MRDWLSLTEQELVRHRASMGREMVSADCVRRGELPPGWVYFISLGDEGSPPRVKIGSTLQPPLTRLRGLQTGSPFMLCLYGQVYAGRAARRLERALHGRFEHLRLRGEWFDFRYEIFRYIVLKAYLLPRLFEEGLL